MKLFIHGIDNPTSGKGFFLSRLAKELPSLGIEIISEPGDADVALYSIKIKHKTKAKVILRLDGIYHNTSMNYKGTNSKIAKNLSISDGVVYQGEFAKKMCNMYLGKHKLGAVISNGADPRFYSSLKTTVKPGVLTAARWRPQKRLVDIVESFLLTSLDCVLYVAGDLSKSGLSKSSVRKYQDTKRVLFLGKLSQSDLALYLIAAKAFVHLSWVDWCPNAVVEAITAKVPVVCNNVGGTQELVAPSGGMVLDVDKPYNGKPIDLYHPPKIDRRLIASAIEKCCKAPPDVTNSHVDIRSIASRYCEFFHKVYRS